MLIYLMRHGIANPAEPGTSDSQRPLSEQGTLQTALVAKGLLQLGIRLDRIIASPLLRAQQTAPKETPQNQPQVQDISSDNNPKVEQSAASEKQPQQSAEPQVKNVGQEKNTP